MPAWSRRIVGVVCLIFFTASCAGDEPTTLERLVPGLPADFAYHVQFSDDDTFRAYIRDKGLIYAENCLHMMREQLPYESNEAYAKSTKELYPFLERTAQAIASELMYERPLLAVEARKSFSPAVAITERKYTAERITIEEDDSLTVEQKIERTKELLHKAEKLGLDGLVIDLKGSLAEFYRESGNRELQIKYLRSRMADCRRAPRNQSPSNRPHSGWCLRPQSRRHCPEP